MSMNLPASTVNTLAGSTIAALAGSTLSGTGSSSGESALVLPATTRDTLGGSTVSTLAGSVISSSNEVYLPEEPAIVIPSYKYYREVTYDTRLGSDGNYREGYPYSYLRLFIKDDEHLRDHAQLNGFDIFFVDIWGCYMPFELVYYSEGTGEWWLKPGSYSDVYMPEVDRLDGHPSSYHATRNSHSSTSDEYYYESNGWLSYISNNQTPHEISFYMLYGDRNAVDHQETTTDPTQPIWIDEPGSGIIAHSSYRWRNGVGILDGPVEFPESNQEDRPTNSLIYSGHTSSNRWTGLDTRDYNRYLTSVGNACRIEHGDIYSANYPFLTSRADHLVGYSIDSMGQISPGGSANRATCLVFGLAVPESTITDDDCLGGSQDKICERVYPILRYRSLVFAFHEMYKSCAILFGIPYTYTVPDDYPEPGLRGVYTGFDYSTGGTFSVPENGGVLCYVYYYTTQVEDVTTYHVRVECMSGIPGTGRPSTNGAYDRQLSKEQYYDYEDGIILRDPRCYYGGWYEGSSAEWGSGLPTGPRGSYPLYASMGAPLLEVRTDVPLWPPYNNSYDTNDDSPSSYNSWVAETFWNMVFDNERHRTISSPYKIGGQASLLLLNHSKTYQGLSGGCN